jgi:GT2 family glycosyltransferase
VSVIVVCWNAAQVLGRCLDQLLAQDYPDYEIIVIDDGSSDETLAVAEAARGRGEVTVVSSPRNRGCPHARNLGLARAGGEIVAFVDADGFAAADWLREVVAAFGTDETVGGVASTVFYDANPLVMNGAGGTVNHQGWAADLSMNEPYERAQIACEALYPMGCGMALRRSAVDAVGPFDDRMLNYYDDVDYGVRLWRAGYRVVVASDAWIDHGVGGGGGDSARKGLLCERHRMRVVLKHAPPGVLGRWVTHEVRALRRAAWSARVRKLRAMAWNARHLLDTLADRRRLRGAPVPPDRLIDPSWGDGFPAGVLPALQPRSQDAGAAIDMADPRSAGQLSYGWFPCERVAGRNYRWAGEQAAALIRLLAPAKRLRLDYTHVPADIGGVEVRIRSLDSPKPLTPVWNTHLPWQEKARSIENHPLTLPAGDYEVVFSVAEGWAEPPLRIRSLSLAVASMAFEDSYDIDSGGLAMASQAVGDQLVNGWLDAEESAGRHYRWGGAHAAAIVRLSESANSAYLSYCLPPGSIGGLTLTIRELDGDSEVFSTRLAWHDGDWHEENLPLRLAAGDYLVSFDTETTWSNREGADPSLWGENRSLGFAVSTLAFSDGS